ncbi:PepSY domain-containing protein [Pontibacter vulgaris]|uniref:PepSY domain-containing protein n=1 Tax=Pontibacter vulgaris TaxID=2905679 RepID=UPI001FA72344|nr:PepSY domain-containing protein [Pontibacter vulgaris]
MKRQTHLRIRKAHRYLGLFTGLQFILWTLGGLYFSWSDIDEIHGDHQRNHASFFSKEISLVSPAQVLTNLPQAKEIKSVKLVDVLGEPVYQVSYFTTANGHAHEQTQLAVAATGQLRAPLTKQEAVQMAQLSFSDKAKVKQVEYLTEKNINGHHEYRESPLPAWAVTMDHPTNTTVYVAAERGEVTRFRNNKWRVFDFLWMLHTMDYQGRDNFGNLLLRVFSIAGMVTILSGFVLYFVSSGTRRQLQRETTLKARPKKFS